MARFSRKKVIKHEKCVLIFSINFAWNISHPKKNSARYCHKHADVCTYSALRTGHILAKLEFSRQIFEKKKIRYQISWKPVQWEPTCSMRKDRRTDGHDEATSRLSRFCERAWKHQISRLCFLPRHALNCPTFIPRTSTMTVGPDSPVSIATLYGLDVPEIEYRWGWDFPHPSRPALRATQKASYVMGTRSLFRE